MNEQDMLAVFSTFDPAAILGWENLRIWAHNETLIASCAANQGILDTLRKIHFGAMAANFDEINFVRSSEDKFATLRVALQFGEYVDNVFSSILTYHRPVAEGSHQRTRTEQEIVDKIAELRHMRRKKPFGEMPSENAIFYVVELLLPGFEEIHQRFRSAKQPDAKRIRANLFRKFLKPSS
jgi:hypothetical protein